MAESKRQKNLRRFIRLNPRLVRPMKIKIALIAVIIILSFNPSPQAQSLKKIIFSAKGGGEAMLPFVISQRLGFYKEEGLQSEVVVTRGTIATQALIGGSVGYRTPRFCRRFSAARG